MSGNTKKTNESLKSNLHLEKDLNEYSVEVSKSFIQKYGLLILQLCLLFIIFFIAYFYFVSVGDRNLRVLKTKITEIKETSPVAENLVAFTISNPLNEIPIDNLLIYSLAEEREVLRTNFTNNEINVSGWSSDVRYIPFTNVRLNDKSNSQVNLYLYDSHPNNVINLTKKTNNPKVVSDLIKRSSSSFVTKSRWVTPATFAFYIEDLQTEDNAKYLHMVDVKGNYRKSRQTSTQINELFGEELEIRFNNNLNISENLFENENLNFDFGGTIIGIYDELLVTIEEVGGQFESVEHVEGFKPNTGESSNLVSHKISLYNTTTGETEGDLEIKGEWKFVDAQINNKLRAIIVYEIEDTDGLPNKTRYVIYDIKTLNEKSSFQAEYSRFSEYETAEGYGAFRITADEDWLVYYEGDFITKAGKETSTIRALNLKNGRELILCDQNCADLRIYNPNKVRIL